MIQFLRIAFHFCLILFLTVLTQIGGIAWAIALLFRRRLITFAAAYLALSIAALEVAPMFGRVALTCWRDGPLQVGSWMYCAMNRNYLTPEALRVLEEVAADVAGSHPGTVTLALDASFPFIDGFPLLPHLSHDDGRKVDLAFYYRDETGYAPGEMRSPIGFFAFENGPTSCAPAWPTLRWDLAYLQPLWRDLELDDARMRTVMRRLAAHPDVEKIFLEPYLTERLGVAHGKVRFQGCRAARHDDHIHMQVR